MSRIRAITHRPVRIIAVAAVAAASALTAGVVWADSGDPSAADDCYTWDGDLTEGDSGDAVTELQIRVAGYPGDGEQLVPDGEFSEQTTQAVESFQEAYDLEVTGNGDDATYEQIYELQDDSDCSPPHFEFAELNTCNDDWSGGKVSAEEAKDNGFRVLWQLEAMRHTLGDQPLTVTSGFRSESCNDSVGGAPDSQHLYGTAADLVATDYTLCELADSATGHGFFGIFGPGYPGHDDHTHVDIRSEKTWDAPDCGIASMNLDPNAVP